MFFFASRSWPTKHYICVSLANAREMHSYNLYLPSVVTKRCLGLCSVVRRSRSWRHHWPYIGRSKHSFLFLFSVSIHATCITSTLSGYGAIKSDWEIYSSHKVCRFFHLRFRNLKPQQYHILSHTLLRTHGLPFRHGGIYFIIWVCFHNFIRLENIYATICLRNLVHPTHWNTMPWSYVPFL